MVFIRGFVSIVSRKDPLPTTHGLTYIHTLIHTYINTCSPFVYFFFSLSLSYTHTHTHTHTYLNAPFPSRDVIRICFMMHMIYQQRNHWCFNV